MKIPALEPRLPKSLHWIRGSRRAALTLRLSRGRRDFKALEGSAAPGSLEVLKGLVLDQRPSKGISRLKGS